MPFEGIIADGRGVVVKIMEDGKKGMKGSAVPRTPMHDWTIAESDPGYNIPIF